MANTPTREHREAARAVLKRKIGTAHVSDFFDWAKANVLKEDTPWIHIKTINGTYRWESPKKAAPAPKALLLAKKRKVK